MEEILKQIVTYGIIPAFVGGASYIMKGIFTRIDALEKELPKKVEETEVRQLLTDKIDPIKDDINDIKQDIDMLASKIDKLIDLFLKK